MIPLRDDQPSFSTPFINYFLIALNVLIYLWEFSVGAQSPRALNAFVMEFGLVPRHAIAVLTGHSSASPISAIVPFFSSMFLHASFMHVAGNMLFLWIFGDNVEDFLGHFMYVVFYFSSGIAAAITQVLVNPSSRLPTVGASGAIAGVLGAYFILYPRARVLTWFFIFVFWLPAWVFLGYWFLLQFFSGTVVAAAETAQTGGIAFWAHIGGFAAGAIMIKVFPERPHRYRYGTW